MCSYRAMLQINCDGEPMRDTHFSFSVLPRRLRLHLPHPQLLSQPRPERQRLSQLWEQQVGRGCIWEHFAPQVRAQLVLAKLVSGLPWAALWPVGSAAHPHQTCF